MSRVATAAELREGDEVVAEDGRWLRVIMPLQQYPFQPGTVDVPLATDDAIGCVPRRWAADRPVVVR